MCYGSKSLESYDSLVRTSTQFFHASTMCRHKDNSISSLKSSEGSPICGRDNINAYLVDHFSNIFSTSHPPLIDNFLELVNEVIFAEKNARICKMNMRFLLLLRSLRLIKPLARMR